jgi:nucleoside-diphosphate-sugar epimerase
MDILLTGATGTLGSALARHWVAQGHRVTALVRPGSDRRRLAAVAAQLQWLQADGDELVQTVRAHPAQVVVHTACAYGRRGETPLQLFEANLGLGVRLVQGLLARPTPGRATLLHTGTVLTPEVSLYALAKQQFSDWAQRLAQLQPAQLQCLELRLQHFYGPGDDDIKFSSHVLRSCRQQVPTLALTACTQRRDFIHLDDAVAAIDTVLQRRAELPAWDAVDVGSGEAPPLRDFVETAHRLLGSRTRLDFGALAVRAHEPPLCVADTRRLRAWGWRPRHSLASGLQATIAAEFGHPLTRPVSTETLPCN